MLTKKGFQIVTLNAVTMFGTRTKKQNTICGSTYTDTSLSEKIKIKKFILIQEEYEIRINHINEEQVSNSICHYCKV